jgi:hypothetical protein
MTNPLSYLVKSFLATLALLPAVAEALILQCDHCNDTQMMQHVEDVGRAGVDVVGTTHVADFAGNVLRSFNVQCTGWGHPRSATPGDTGARSGSGGRWWWTCQQFAITPASIDPGMSEHYVTLRAFYLETGGSWTKQVVTPVFQWQMGGPHSGTIAGYSGFDIASDLNARVLVGNALTNHCHLCGLPQIGLLANAFASAFVNAPAGIIVTVRFSDGSSARYAFRFNENWEFTYEPGSARSASGYVIPDVESFGTHGSASFDFGAVGGDGSEAEAFVNYFRNRGGNIIGAGSPVRLICSWDGQTLTCTIHTT